MAGAGAVLLIVAGAVAWQTVLWRSGWFRGPPKIAANLTAIAGATSPPWNARLRDSFPIGSYEDELASELRRQGFDIDETRRRAAYGWAVRPCIYTLTVSWRADDDGRIRAISGGVLNACTDPKALLPDQQPRRRRPAGPPPDLLPDPSVAPPAHSA